MSRHVLRSRWIACLVAFAIALAVTQACIGQQLTATPRSPNGVFAVNEPIEWAVELAPPENPQASTDAKYYVRKNGLTLINQGMLDLASGSAIVTTVLDEPGAVLVEILIGNGGAIAGTGRGRPGQRRGQRGGAGPGQQRGGYGARLLVGAAVEPGRIEPTTTRPFDFDAFWNQQIERIASIPANAQLQEADAAREGVEYRQVLMDTIDGRHIHGQLAKPAGEGKYPALLILERAGVFGLPKDRVTDRAAEGWMALNIEPHDIPIDAPGEFYAQALQGELAHYDMLGAESRETSYFLRMYLSAYQAAEYLAQRPDWDGKTLVVMGTEQGGQQALAVAGLHPAITVMMANAPSGCDVTAPTEGRAARFPDWAGAAYLQTSEAILQTGRYFDPANFAPRIKARALVSVGLIDTTCPPATVYAAYNKIASDQKRMVVMVNSGSRDVNGSQRPFNELSAQWLAALVEGEPPPGFDE